MKRVYSELIEGASSEVETGCNETVLTIHDLLPELLNIIVNFVPNRTSLACVCKAWLALAESKLSAIWSVHDLQLAFRRGDGHSIRRSVYARDTNYLHKAVAFRVDNMVKSVKCDPMTRARLCVYACIFNPDLLPELGYTDFNCDYKSAAAFAGNRDLYYQMKNHNSGFSCFCKPDDTSEWKTFCKNKPRISQFMAAASGYIDIINDSLQDGKFSVNDNSDLVFTHHDGWHAKNDMSQYHDIEALIAGALVKGKRGLAVAIMKQCAILDFMVMIKMENTVQDIYEHYNHRSINAVDTNHPSVQKLIAGDVRDDLFKMLEIVPLNLSGLLAAACCSGDLDIIKKLIAKGSKISKMAMYFISKSSNAESVYRLLKQHTVLDLGAVVKGLIVSDNTPICKLVIEDGVKPEAIIAKIEEQSTYSCIRVMKLLATYIPELMLKFAIKHRVYGFMNLCKYSVELLSAELETLIGSSIRCDEYLVGYLVSKGARVSPECICKNFKPGFNDSLFDFKMYDPQKVLERLCSGLGNGDIYMADSMMLAMLKHGAMPSTDDFKKMIRYNLKRSVCYMENIPMNENDAFNYAISCIKLPKNCRHVGERGRCDDLDSHDMCDILLELLRFTCSAPNEETILFLINRRFNKVAASAIDNAIRARMPYDYNKMFMRTCEWAQSVELLTVLSKRVVDFRAALGVCIESPHARLDCIKFIHECCKKARV